MIVIEMAANTNTQLYVNNSAITILPLTDGQVLVKSGTDMAGVTPNTVWANGYTAENVANKNVANGYAGLGPLGKIDASQMPSAAVTDTYLVANQADLVTLTTAEKGDIGIVNTDPDDTLRGSWILMEDPYSTLSNWVQLIPPTSAGVVYTVNGQMGPNVIVSASSITTGTLPAAQLPAFTSSAEIIGTSSAGPHSLSMTGVAAGTYLAPEITVDNKGRISTATLPSIPSSRLSPSGVTPGTYTNPVLTINSQGLITASSAGPAILYQQNSTITPGSTIIAKIGIADESTSITAGTTSVSVNSADGLIFTNAAKVSTPSLTLIGQSSAPDDIITGSIAGDTCIQSVSGNGQNILFSVDNTAPPVKIIYDANSIVVGADAIQLLGSGQVFFTSLPTLNIVNGLIGSTSSGQLVKKSIAVGTVVSGAGGLWTFTHGLGQIPSVYYATALNNNGAVTGQYVVSYNTATTTVITGRVMVPIGVILGGNPFNFVTGANVRVYCQMI